MNTLYHDLPVYHAMLDREGVDSPCDLVVWGSGADVIAGLRRYVGAGATELRVGVSAVDDVTKQRSHPFLAELAGA